MLHVGIDIGGTFTDLVLMDDGGNVTTAKALSTPHSADEGVFAALELAAQQRGESLTELLTQVETFSYGTTQATNAVIERTGAKTGLITTQGFGDTIFLQRLLGMTAGLGPEELGHYSRRAYPDPIVPKDLIREVPERVDQAGTVLQSLDLDAARRAVEELLDAEVDAIAVSLLWSFRNPEHEQAIERIARELADDEIVVSLSSNVSPVMGEYERTATTVINAYLAPAVRRYLNQLKNRLRSSGFRGTFSVLNSIGGVMSARAAAERAVLLVSSGPTGGVIGSRYLAEALGHSNVLTTDMGGTSFDVGMIVDGRPTISSVNEVSKYHVALPMVDIRAVGSGGGSIASVRDGLIRVGPESAGASPGPVCYGRGGTRATVTDADVVLGIIDPDSFLGGRMTLDAEAAKRAIDEQIAQPLGIEVVEAAAGIRRIVDGQMADTLGELTIGRGHDPRDFVLYAYGGAGPMHCGGFGAELGVRQIVVPATSMVHSAYGALASDMQHSAEVSRVVRGGGAGREPWEGIDAADLEASFAALEEQCQEVMKSYGIELEDLTLSRSCDMRFRRQQHQLMIPVAEHLAGVEDVVRLAEEFQSAYEATYGPGAGFREAGIEITTLRVDAIGHTKKPKLARTLRTDDSEHHERPVYDFQNGGFAPATVADWSAITPGEEISGPAIIEHPATTVYIAARQTASIDEYGNLLIHPAAARAGVPVISDGGTEVDPITFEVIRNKLRAVAEEMAITLKSASGSPVVVGANDFNNGIYQADGSVVTMGAHILFHSATMSTVVRSIISDYSENPGIAEGDMFILNDPYRGAVHQHDVTIVAPIFYEGERVAWAGTCAHQLDVGGMNFGSWSLKATDIQMEAMLLPGVKIVESGEIRRDIWQLIMGQTRLPHMVGLDLKGMIAANAVANRRMVELIDRYGRDEVLAVMEREQDVSEQKFRDRLRSLPDGTFRAVDYMEHDGHENRLYEICTALHKRGDELHFDMTGSSPQAPGFINCTAKGLVGALFASLLPVLAPDIRWNEGLMRAITVEAPEGTIVSARWPAPVSMASVGAMWVVANVGAMATARLVACSPELRQEAAAVNKGSIQILTLSALDRDGVPWGTPLLDAMAGGGGAHPHKDGLDGAGDYTVPLPSIGNVESLEAEAPLLYLFRRLIPDTGGPGRQRGGASLGLAVTAHDTDHLDAMLIAHGVEVPNSTGLSGGYEGSCNVSAMLPACSAGSPIGRIVDEESAFGADGARPMGSKPGFFDIGGDEVFAYSFQGGGGYGDPIEREPVDLLADVRRGLVSVAGAESSYGVVIDGDEVDQAATYARRDAIRRERLGGNPPKVAGRDFEHAFLVVSDSLAVDSDGAFRCRCGTRLGPCDENFKDHAVSRIVDPATHGRITLHEDLELREHICPGCGALLESEVARKGAPDLQSIQIDMAALPTRGGVLRRRRGSDGRPTVAAGEITYRKGDGRP